ncbi:GNAT family N-acetyltransferase [Sphingobacterium faecale]|uniref:GNAT family N-acetyltransferase n=1 Tax=Sphingobacterium faecale TaxID=2803775 RepID=A0ABS1R1I6_9SPHI|nr:GNAT family N-acetyltransferase [Sphingobacterium faecale]MBL1408330.1 GNAT family N-acetyltransferase [Sphingobacterium faecale]
MFSGIIFRKATISDVDAVWAVLEEAIAKRRNDGSDQWQDGYPNREVIVEDVEKGYGFVAERIEGAIVAYIAVIGAIEPAYEALTGKWLTERPYTVIHRLAVSQRDVIKGLGTWMMLEAENVSLSQDRLSIKVDTNYDNAGMLRVFDKLGYVYCGEVYFRGGAQRKAFEKLLDQA